MEQQDLATMLQEHGIPPMTLIPVQTSRQEQAYKIFLEKDGAIAAWHTLRSISETTGLWPIIVDDGEQKYVEYDDLSKIPTDAILQAGLRMDPAIWLRERFVALGLEELSAEPWPEGDHSQHQFLGPSQSVYARPFVRALLLPTTRGWEAPAYLDAGGSNECPVSEEQVCMMHSWHERFGAEPVILLPDIIEMHVARPPHNRESALRLAREHFIYAPDNVYQGTQTLPALAATLLHATVWFFWWD